MPIRDEAGKQWLCEVCRTSFKYKKEAKACEQRHRWLKAWADGDITDQELADYLGIHVESVRAMTLGGSDATLTSKKPGERKIFQGGMGTLVNITQLHSQGRTQVPYTIRDEMGLNDGDRVYWYKSPDGRYYIDNHQVTSEGFIGKEIRVARG